jgi:hypothetical protein
VGNQLQPAVGDCPTCDKGTIGQAVDKTLKIQKMDMLGPNGWRICCPCGQRYSKGRKKRRGGFPLLAACFWLSL